MLNDENSSRAAVAAGLAAPILPAEILSILESLCEQIAKIEGFSLLASFLKWRRGEITLS